MDFRISVAWRETWLTTRILYRLAINQLENVSFTNRFKNSITHCSFVFVLSDDCIAEEFKQNHTSDQTDEWTSTTLPRLLDEYTPDDIYNADESGLFYSDKYFAFASSLKAFATANQWHSRKQTHVTDFFM